MIATTSPDAGCPRCSAPLVPGAPACPACHLRLVGQDAAELWALDQQLATLTHRRGELLAELAAVPAAVPADPYCAPGASLPAAPVPPQQSSRASAPPASSAPRQRRFGAQQLLLVTGVLLIGIAAVVFTAYAWDSIGVLGQAAVLLAVCAGAAAGSRACARRELGASAEALAVLAVIVLLVLVGSARSLDVLGLGSTDPDAYRLGGLLLSVAATAAGDRWLRAGARPVAPAWSAVLLTAAVPSVLASAVNGELLTWAAGALTLAVLSVPATRLLAARARGLGRAGLVVGAVHLVLGVLALLAVDVSAGGGFRDPAGAATQFALLAAAASWVASRAGRPDSPRPALLAGRPGVRRFAVVVAYGGAVGGLVSLAVAGGTSAMLLLAFGIAVTAGLLLAVRPSLLPWPVLVAALALAGASLVSEPLGFLSEGTWWRPAAWYALAVASLLAGQRRPVSDSPAGVATTRSWSSREPALARPRAVWAVAAGLATFGGSVLAPAPLSAPGAVASAVVAAAALAALSALVRGAPEWVLVGAWALTVLASVQNVADGPVHVAVPLGVAGLAALARAGARDRTAWAVPGVLLLSIAWWSETDLVAPPGAGVEWWSLPPALLALAVGVLVWQRHPALGSWVVLGAGLAVGLLPSALQGAIDGTSEGNGWRVAAVAVASAVVCVAGVRWGWQAPVVLGAAAAVTVAVGQLGPYALQLPTSVGLFAAGAVVIVLAVRIEQARRDAARAVGWVRALR